MTVVAVRTWRYAGWPGGTSCPVSSGNVCDLPESFRVYDFPETVHVMTAPAAALLRAERGPVVLPANAKKPPPPPVRFQ